MVISQVLFFERRGVRDDAPRHDLWLCGEGRTFDVNRGKRRADRRTYRSQPAEHEEVTAGHFTVVP
jgi:hypothetical protein